MKCGGQEKQRRAKSDQSVVRSGPLRRLGDAEARGSDPKDVTKISSAVDELIALYCLCISVIAGIAKH